VPIYMCITICCRAVKSGLNFNRITSKYNCLDTSCTCIQKKTILINLLKKFMDIPVLILVQIPKKKIFFDHPIFLMPSNCSLKNLIVLSLPHPQRTKRGNEHLERLLYQKGKVDNHKLTIKT
jgi:hypothetical protein